jgi:uncharacterized protein (TIGR01777 family)
LKEPQRILLTGASGLIGGRLSASLQNDGHEVIRLVRRPTESPAEYRWDPSLGSIDERALKGLDVVINLSGAGIGDKRWTTARKAEIYDSRIGTTQFLAESLAVADERPAVFISQSAIGIYGDRGDELLTEESAVGPLDDFLAALTIDWEAAAAPASVAGIRVVHPRTGLVLARDAQLMRRLVPLFKAGLGGPIGDGRQWWSWITLNDVVGAITHLIDSDLAGPVNLVAPAPVRQREFATALAGQLRRPSKLPVPRFGVRLALGGEKAEAIGYSSTRVVPHRLDADGYQFADPELAPALRGLLT